MTYTGRTRHRWLFFTQYERAFRGYCGHWWQTPWNSHRWPMCYEWTYRKPLKAPWSDFEGGDIFAGDTIQHPDKTEAVVTYVKGSGHPCDDWKVLYCDGTVSRLCLQIGDRGRAVKIETESGR